jgi:hypothetical protein
MFFSKITSNYEGGPKDEPEEEGQVKAKELESILSLCKARGGLTPCSNGITAAGTNR